MALAIGLKAIFLLAFLFLLVVSIILVLKLLMRRAGGGASPEKRRLQDGEARTIQDLYAQMERTEKRIEALETILLDKMKQ